MGKPVETRTEKQTPRDTVYGDASPDDFDEGRDQEPEPAKEDESPDDFERGKSDAGARDQHKKHEPAKK